MCCRLLSTLFFYGLGRIDVVYTHRPPRLAMPVRPLVCCLRVPTLDPLHDIGRPKRLQDASCQSSTSPSKPAPTAAYDLCPMLFVVLFPLASIERPRNLGHCFAAFRSRFFFKSVRLQSLQQQLTTFRQMAQSDVVTKRRNAPSYLTRQLFLLSPVLLQKPHSAGSSCAAELVHIEIFMPDRCEARLPPPTLLARLSPDSDCAKVDLMKNRIFHTKLTVGFCFSRTTLC